MNFQDRLSIVQPNCASASPLPVELSPAEANFKDAKAKEKEKREQSRLYHQWRAAQEKLAECKVDVEAKHRSLESCNKNCQFLSGLMKQHGVTDVTRFRLISKATENFVKEYETAKQKRRRASQAFEKSMEKYQIQQVNVEILQQKMNSINTGIIPSELLEDDSFVMPTLS